MLMLAERLLAVPLLAAFLLLSGCLALRLVYPLIRWPKETAPVRLYWLLDRLLLGSGLLVAVLFVFASIGIYRPFPLILLAALVAVFGSAFLWQSLRANSTVRSSPKSSTSLNRTVRWQQLWLGALSLAFAVLLSVLWLESIRPDLAWDSDVYHLTLPRLFLAEGGFFSVPFSVYSHWPSAVELLFGMAMAVHDYVLAKQLHFVFGLLLLLALFLSTPLGKLPSPGNSAQQSQVPIAGLLACALFITNPVVLFEIRTAYVDLALALFVLAAYLCAERILTVGAELGVFSPNPPSSKPLAPQSSPPSKTAANHAHPDLRRYHLALGTACGLAAASKLSGFMAALAVLGVFWILFIRRAGLRTTSRNAIFVIAPLLLLALPWPLKSWILTGNPTYPLFFDLFGGPDWSAALGAQHSAWQQTIGMGRSLTDFLLLPWRVITQGGRGYEHFDGQLHLAWLIFVPLGLVSLRSDSRQRWLLSCAGLLFSAWALTSQQMRLLIPALALLSLAAGRAVDHWLGRDSAWKFAASAVATTVMLALAFFHAKPYTAQAPRLARDLASLGYASKQAVIHPVYSAIDELPTDGQLLLLNTNRGFFINRPYLADSFFEASQIIDQFAPMASPREASEELQRRGISHILIENRQPGMPYPPSIRNLLSDGQLTELVYQSEDDRFAILKLL